MSEEENTSCQNQISAHLTAPIVAIGGAAGAEQALTELLQNLPADSGLAFVYVQHISEGDYIMDALRAATTMPISAAVHLMPVEPDHLYIIPPGQVIEVIDGVLVMSHGKSGTLAHLPIDQFFISLANRQKEGAIGIILSGDTSDGTLGLKAIKAAGGITFAQDNGAQLKMMPQSAMREGVVDMVLSPKEIGVELQRLSARASILQLTIETSESRHDDEYDDALEEILQMVKIAVGVDFCHYRKTTLHRRIIRRMLLYKLETFNEYVEYLKQHPSEANALYSDLLINVTDFFRDEHTMVYVRKELLPAIIKNKSDGEPVRIWIAGCSTGQEAYSFAIMICEIQEQQKLNIPVHIFGTDLSEPAIARARLGVYSSGELTGVSAKRLERFFSKTDGDYRINKFVRDMCVFAPHNLLSDPPFSRLDLVSCRNLLIYLDDMLQKKALATFHYALNPDGYLLLGKSEAVGSSPSHFLRIEKTHKVFARKNNTHPRFPVALINKKEPSTQDHKNHLVKNTSTNPINDLDHVIDNLLLSKYVPPSVVVDQDLEIIQFRGSTGLFLEPAPGKASLNLAKMARPSLIFELRNIIHKARKSGLPASKSGIKVTVDEKAYYVGLQATPVKSLENQQLFLIVFEELKGFPAATGDAPADADKLNQMLEAELAALRQDMHSIIEEQEASNEELQTANEEIISSNEELQSINEELETSKEEIEAANEELIMINQELQIRNEQLTEAYEYSESILSTVKEATLVLDTELIIRSANKAFYKIFSTTPHDTEGRMLYEFASKGWNFEGFRDLLEDVITHDTAVKGFEVHLNLAEAGERVMLLHARKAVRHQKQTILLVFEDITEHKKVQKLLQERQQWFEELVDHAPALIWVARADGKIDFLNKAWLDFTGLPPVKNNGMTFLQAIHPADQKSYLDISYSHMAQRKSFSFEYRLLRRDGEYRWVLENSKPMFSSDGQFTGYIGSCTDMHLQKTLTQQLNHHVDERTRELKIANAELESSNQELTQTADRLQSVLNGVPASVTLMEAVFSKEGQVIDFTTSAYNEKALELTNLTVDEITSKTLLEAHPGLRGSDLFNLYVQVFNSGESAYKEISGFRSAEETLAFLITRQVDKKGVVVTVLDITKRKQAEAKVIQTAESLQAVLDSAPSSIGFFKGIFNESEQVQDFNLIVCNQMFSKSFNKPLSELIGWTASQLYPEQRVQAMKHVVMTKDRYYEEVYIEEREKWIGVSITRHDHGVAITELDITTLREAQHQQEELIRQLEGTGEMIKSLDSMKQYIQQRGEFLRSTSHDLRGSFGIIVGATSLLNMLDTDEDRAKTLDMLQRNLRQVTQMINQLLDYSRLESGEEQLQTAQFDAAVMLAELCEGSNPVAAEKGLWIRSEGVQSLSIEGDMVKVRRIAQNLILNALKYTSSGGVIVSWESRATPGSKPVWQFMVQDTGPGLPNHLIKKLTGSENDDDILDSSQEMLKKREHNLSHGEGIGLFIVKRLCELLQAEMYITSDADSGTVFRIVFPQLYHNQND